MSAEFPAVEGSPAPPEKPLYPYQEDMLGAIQGARQSDINQTFIDVATGCGKDFTIARDVRDFLEESPSRRILYLCHNAFILKQASDEISAVTDIASHGRMFGGEFEDQEQIVFATFQTMSRPLGGGRTYEAFDPEEFDYIIVNESHHGPAPTYRPVIEYFKPSFLLGATATPDRRDEQDIREIFGEPAYTLKLEEAIAKGYLTKPDYHVLTDHVRHLDSLTTPKGVSRKDIEEINGMVFVPKRDEEIVNTITEHLKEIKDPRTLIFCASISHTEHFSTLLPGASAALHSELPKEEQEKRLKAFREGEIPTLLVVDMLNEGVDVPEINTVVFLRSTESKTVFFQQLGRGLRKAPGKDKVTILDFVANWDRLTILKELQSNIKDYQLRGKHKAREIDSGDISFNFSPEAMEAVQVAQEARNRERNHQAKTRSNPRLDKWAAEATALKAMLGDAMPDRIPLTIEYWDQLAERLAKGDETVVEEIVMRSLYNAYGTAKQHLARLGSNELSLEDHFHHAIEGIYAGIKRYSPDKGKGSSLRDQISLGVYGRLNHTATNRGLIRIPSHIQQEIDRIKKARQKLVPELGSMVLTGAADFDDEVAEISGIDPKTIAYLRRLEQTLDYKVLLPIEMAKDTPDNQKRSPYEHTADLMTLEVLKESLENLSYRERRVLELRYGLGGQDQLNLDDVARLFNVTRERIRQIENQSLKKLQQLPVVQPLRKETEEYRSRPTRQRRYQQQRDAMRRTLEHIASNTLKTRSAARYEALKRISEEAPAYIVGLSEVIMRALEKHQKHPIYSVGFNRNVEIDKHWLFNDVEKRVLEVKNGSGVSYSDYVKALNHLDEHGLIRTVRNERGTIIESIALR